ncbi:hypothetical protein LCGC14_2866190, partial [marine sediment metagenome]
LSGHIGSYQIMEGLGAIVTNRLIIQEIRIMHPNQLFTRKGNPMDERQRLRIWDRDNGTCQLCGGPGSEINHIEHKGLGGRHGEAKKRSESDSNLQLVCLICHRTKIHG